MLSCDVVRNFVGNFLERLARRRELLIAPYALKSERLVPGDLKIIVRIDLPISI